MTSGRSTNSGKTTNSRNAINQELATKGKKSQREIISRDGKFDYRKNIAAIERGRSPGDSEIHHEESNISDSNRGGESDYVYSPSSDREKNAAMKS